jgi:hypothetical protein
VGQRAAAVVNEKEAAGRDVSLVVVVEHLLHQVCQLYVKA